MQKDLFGKRVLSQKKKKFETALRRYDKRSFNERLERLTHLNKILPKGSSIGSDLETFYVFDEVKMAFVNGELISTILLSQAFIERKFQMHYNSIGLEKISKRGLSAIISHAKKNKTIHNFLIERADMLRKKRNPFVHLKEYDHEFNLSQRIFQRMKEKKSFKQPREIIFEDAKEAISLMYAVFITNMN